MPPRLRLNPEAEADLVEAFAWYERRLPYAVFFIAGPDAIAVSAVMHGKRDPKRWQMRR